MTFQEYINQKDPKPFPRVEITPEDCSVIQQMYNQIHVTLEIFGDSYRYIVPKDSHLLYTDDGEGNPKNISCFHLEDKQEFQNLNSYEK